MLRKSCWDMFKLTLVERHAILLPGAALINPAGVGVRAVVGHGHPGETTNVRWHQGHIGSASGLNRWDHVDRGVWVGGAHESPILFELTEWSRDLVGLWEFTVNPEVLLNVSNAGVHLWPSRGVPEPRVKIQEAGFLVWICCSDYIHNTWQACDWEKSTNTLIYEIWFWGSPMLMEQLIFSGIRWAFCCFHKIIMCLSTYISCRTPPILPTVSSSSCHQEDGTRASEPAPPDCSTAFSLRLWEPWTQIPPPLSETWTPPPPTLPHHRKKLSVTFLGNSKCAKHRWVGLYKQPVVTHSLLFTLDTFHTLLCAHNPTKRLNIICMFTNVYMHYQSLYTVPQPAAWLTMFQCTVFIWSIRTVCIVCIFSLRIGKHLCIV